MECNGLHCMLCYIVLMVLSMLCCAVLCCVTYVVLLVVIRVAKHEYTNGAA